ncbi:endonuclease [Haploplasma axanthum]|nr:endonuclease [Haploplasma axanthum]
MKKLLLVVNIVIFSIVLVSCNFIRKEKFRVTFKLDGEVHEQKEIEKGNLITKPSEPNKVGFEIIGWYKDINDEETKWNFETDKVLEHLELTGKWKRKDNYLEIQDLRHEDSILTWLEIPNAEYEIRLLYNIERTSNNSFDISKYKEIIAEKEILTIVPIKEGFIGLERVIDVQYKKANEKENINLNFDSLSKGNYASSMIDFSGFIFELNGALIGTSASDLKNGAKSVRMQENGFISFVTGINRFQRLTFNLGTYGTNNDSNVNVYVKGFTETEYRQIKTFKTIKELVNVEVSINDVPEDIRNNTLLFKIEKDNVANARVNIDDLIVYDLGEEKYIIGADEDIDLLPYYESVRGLKGEKLVEELRIILNTNFNSLKYEDAKYVLANSDRNPLDGNNSLLGMYDNDSIVTYWTTGANAWQREHVWPNSRLGIERVKESSRNQGSDMHNLRAITGINQTRSNRHFTNGNGVATKVGSNAFYPGDDHKGDVARILLYMAVKYDFLMLTKNETLLSNSDSYLPKGAYGGRLDLLLDWHNDDQVDEFEKNRNEFIFSGVAKKENGSSISPQGNRNPFIDHPELFTEVYNYFLNADLKRLANMNVSVDLIIDYYKFMMDMKNI